MAKNPAKIPISDFKQDASATLKRVRKSKRPLIVTQGGKPAAVLLSGRQEGDRLVFQFFWVSRTVACSTPDQKLLRSFVANPRLQMAVVDSHILEVDLPRHL